MPYPEPESIVISLALHPNLLERIEHLSECKGFTREEGLRYLILTALNSVTAFTRLDEGGSDARDDDGLVGEKDAM